MGPAFEPDDVGRLGAAVGVEIPRADLRRVADALAAHCRLVAPLLDLSLEGESTITRPKPGWDA